MPGGKRMLDSQGRRVISNDGKMALGNDGDDCCCASTDCTPADGCDPGFDNSTFLSNGEYPAGISGKYKITPADSGKIFVVDGFKRRLSCGGASQTPVSGGTPPTPTPLTPEDPQSTCVQCWHFKQGDLDRGFLSPLPLLKNPGELFGRVLCAANVIVFSAPIPNSTFWDGKIYSSPAANIISAGGAGGPARFPFPTYVDGVGGPLNLQVSVRLNLNTTITTPQWELTVYVGLYGTITYIEGVWVAPFDPNNPMWPETMSLSAVSADGLYNNGQQALLGTTAKLDWSWTCDSPPADFSVPCSQGTPPAPSGSGISGGGTPGSGISGSPSGSTTPSGSTVVSGAPSGSSGSSPSGSVIDSYKLKRCADGVVLDDLAVKAFNADGTGANLQTKTIYLDECYQVTNIATTGGSYYTGTVYDTCAQCVAHHTWIQISECTPDGEGDGLINIWMLVSDWQSAPIYGSKVFKVSEYCYYIDAGSPRVTTVPDVVLRPGDIDSVWDDCDACAACDCPTDLPDTVTLTATQVEFTNGDESSTWPPETVSFKLSKTGECNYVGLIRSTYDTNSQTFTVVNRDPNVPAPATAPGVYSFDGQISLSLDTGSCQWIVGNISPPSTRAGPSPFGAYDGTSYYASGAISGKAFNVVISR